MAGALLAPAYPIGMRYGIQIVNTPVTRILTHLLKDLISFAHEAGASAIQMIYK